MKPRFWYLTVTSYDPDAPPQDQVHAETWIVWPEHASQTSRSLRKKYGKPMATKDGSMENAQIAHDVALLAGDVVKVDRP